MLWQKESESDAAVDGSIYVDLLQHTNYQLSYFRLHRKKNNAQSLRTRTEGNHKFFQNDIEGAMKLYNQSVCFAEKGSEHLSLAYSNRSNCFFRLHLYERCMADIQLAKAANLPERLMSKLDDRQRECLKRRSSSVTTESEPMLSFDADEKFPCMANVLDIKRSDQYGRLVRAKHDIKIGETILIEPAYIHIAYGLDENRCEYCSKKKMNFIPCDNCSDTMYCSEECAKNNFHDAECDMLLGSKDCLGGRQLTFVLRSVIMAVNTFPTVEELMDFVANCRQSDPLDLPESVDTAIAKYRTFFKLVSVVTTTRISNLLHSAYIIFKTIMGSKLGKKFDTKASQRFLVHLTIHHDLIVRLNAFGGYTDPPFGIFGQAAITDKDNARYEQEIYLLTSLFNHSCTPNVIKLVKDSVSVCKALLPIKKGEQLFISYSHDDAYGMTEKQRNDELELTYGFRCKCTVCTKGFRPGEFLLCDPNFKFINGSLPRLMQRFDIGLLREIKRRCIEFLEKYHLHWIATKEATFILANMGAMLELELNGR